MTERIQQKIDSALIREFFAESMADRRDLHGKVNDVREKVDVLTTRVGAVEIGQQDMGGKLDRLVSVVEPIERLDKQRATICLMARFAWKGGTVIGAIVIGLAAIQKLGLFA